MQGDRGDGAACAIDHFRILDELEEFLVREIETICVFFEGQDVEALVRMRIVKEKVRGILEGGNGGKPKFICQLRDA